MTHMFGFKIERHFREGPWRRTHYWLLKWRGMSLVGAHMCHPKSMLLNGHFREIVIGTMLRLSGKRKLLLRVELVDDV